MALRQLDERPAERHVRSGRHGVSADAGRQGSSSHADVCRRPGVLVLINDADWELEGEDKYEVQTGDNIVFVSTLHGG